MIPSDAIIAGLCGLIYQPTAIVKGFDHFDAGGDDGVTWAFKHLDGCDLIVFRGSVTLPDWIADFRAAAVPTRIGHVHAGFYGGMETVLHDVRPMLSQPFIIAGHSLGAARADILTGMMVTDGVPPIARVVFGEPKPGLLDFSERIKDVPGRSYRNGDGTHHDLVTDVPFSFPPLQYMHPTPIIPVNCPPRADHFSDWGAFAWHHIELYETALAALAIQGSLT